MGPIRQAPSSGKRHVSVTAWLWPVHAVMALLSLGLASECFSFTTSPASLTFTADQGSTNLSSQTLSVYRNGSRQTSLTNSESASWLMVSPATTSMTSAGQLTVAVNPTGLAAGTYKTTITINVGKRSMKRVPVRLVISPSSPPPPPAASTATLAWSPVIDPTVAGYKVYVGTASGLYSRDITVGNLTSYTVDSLSLGNTYFFVVTAYSSDGGESLASNEVSKSIY